MKKYLILVKGGFMTILIHRFHFLNTSISNIFYVILTYFLWGSIYSGSSKLNGLTFNQTFVYLTFAMSIYCLFQVQLEWKMSMKVLNGSIVSSIIKPIDLQLQTLFESVGILISNFITITLPGILATILIFRGQVHIGINILFGISFLLLAFLISFNIDYIVGTFSFYTESIWGISITKEVIVLLLSGAVIPLNFFPANIKMIIEILPFQAIYNIPLLTLTSSKLCIYDYLKFLMLQIIWLIILTVISRLFYNRALKVITVNGG